MQEAINKQFILPSLQFKLQIVNDLPKGKDSMSNFKNIIFLVKSVILDSNYLGFFIHTYFIMFRLNLV